MATNQKQLIEEIKVLQAKAAAGRELISGITVKLSEVESTQSAAHLAERSIPDLIRKKQILQADVSLGNAGAAQELAKVDEEISKAQEAVEYHNHTVSGLKQRLAEANANQETLNYSLYVQGAKFIRACAEEVNAEYISHARATISLFRRLKAFDCVYKAYPFSPEPFADGLEFRDLSLPVFRFNPDPNQVGRPVMNLIGETGQPGSYEQADFDAEVKHLVAAGLELNT